jgi:hypothetical protein
MRRVRPDEKQARVGPGCPREGAFRDVDSNSETRRRSGLRDLVKKKPIAAADVQYPVAGVVLRAIAGDSPCQPKERWQLMHANPRLNHLLVISDFLIVASPMEEAQVTFSRQVKVVPLLARVGAPGTQERFGADWACD